VDAADLVPAIQDEDVEPDHDGLAPAGPKVPGDESILTDVR